MLISLLEIVGGLFYQVFKAKLKWSVKCHLSFCSFPSYFQVARLLMLVWVKRCIFCVKDMENQLVINPMKIFCDGATNDFLTKSEIFSGTWLHVCVACLCSLTEHTQNLFSFSYTGFTNWNVLRRLVACPRKCGQNNKGEEMKQFLGIILNGFSLNRIYQKYIFFLLC